MQADFPGIDPGPGGQPIVKGQRIRLQGLGIRCPGRATIAAIFHEQRTHAEPLIDPGHFDEMVDRHVIAVEDQESRAALPRPGIGRWKPEGLDPGIPPVEPDGLRALGHRAEQKTRARPREQSAIMEKAQHR